MRSRAAARKAVYRVLTAARMRARLTLSMPRSRARHTRTPATAPLPDGDLVIARRLGAIGAVSALVRLSIVGGTSIASAAIPAPPTIDSLFTPWVTSGDQRGLQGNKDLDVTQIDITITNEAVTNAPDCTVPTTVGATVWYTCEPTTAIT